MIAPYETAPEMGDGGHAASKDGDTVQQPGDKENSKIAAAGKTKKSQIRTWANRNGLASGARPC